MIEIKGKQFRNLEEQVLYLSQMIERILDTNVLLAQFGIKVIDQVESEAALQEKYPRTTFQGEYGDAVLVGAQRPYDYYIWTRPFDEEVYGDWFNIGQFPLPGPQGVQGATGQTGARGQRGNKWYTGQGIPSTSITDMIVGDLYLDISTSQVYRYLGTESRWVLTANIKGQRGESGRDGAAGPSGPVVDLVGILTSVDQLPEDIASFVQTYGRQGAYLIGPEDADAARYVWGLTGTDDNLQWTDLGLFASGTIVYVNGQPVETIEMSNYVPEVVDTSKQYSISVYNALNDSYVAIALSQAVDGGTIPIRTPGGLLRCGTPVNGTDAVNKNYLDQRLNELGTPAPASYYALEDLWYKEYNEDLGYDEYMYEYPKYIELRPGMDFYIEPYVSSDESTMVGVNIVLIANNSPTGILVTKFDAASELNLRETQRYHIKVSKGIGSEAMVVSVEALSFTGDSMSSVPNFESGYLQTYSQANLQIDCYYYNDYTAMYEGKFLYIGNTIPNIQLSPIK